MIQTNITNIGDPYVLRYGGIYYMYATSAKNGFKVFSSSDLNNWSEGETCYFDSAWGENDFWAPEVIEYKNKFYMFFTARYKKNHSLRLGVAVSDSPQGRFIDINDAPLFDFGYAVIDGTVFIENDKAYLYFVKDCSENIINGIHTSEIFGVELDETLTKLLGEPVKLTTPDSDWETSLSSEWRWNEGPAVLKNKNKYYMCYSVNCFDSRYYSVGYATSFSPLGSFIKAEENPIMSFIEDEISGPGHNSFFKKSNGELMTAFHIHTDYNKPSGNRRACIAKAYFDNNDKLVIDYKNK